MLWLFKSETQKRAPQGIYIYVPCILLGRHSCTDIHKCSANDKGAAPVIGPAIQCDEIDQLAAILGI